MSFIAFALGIAALYIVVPPLLRHAIRRRLGGYVRDANIVDLSQPLLLPLTTRRRVAVIGGGVAGLTAALTLSRRGFHVTVFEKQAHLGGKLGSWQVELAPGRTVWVSHGFHAFFAHYHSMNQVLDSLGLRRSFKSIGDYVIIGKEQSVRFAGLDRTPIFNLLSLARAGVFALREALRAPGRDLYGVFLEYEHASNVERFDHLSFAQFDALAQVPPRLKVAFNTFARAFFADEDKLSLAELVKSFHFYYLGHDGGLVYEYPELDYEAAFLRPIRSELESKGAVIRTSTSVNSLRRSVEGSFAVNDEVFDKVVMAADVVGAKHIMTAAQGLPAEITKRFEQLKAGQRYAVLRVWVDRDVREDVPVFVITDRARVLDAVAVYHRFEKETQADLAKYPGFVLELHCYAVPEELTDREVRDGLLDELQQFFPETKGLSVAHEVLQVKRDFTAFHVGQGATRPTVETGVSGLTCAGDWVKLPFPAMLLECACASGLWAANAVLREEGLREEPVRSVPLRGVMAGLPVPPTRQKLLASGTSSAPGLPEH